jgi:hypothetical protein
MLSKWCKHLGRMGRAGVTMDSGGARDLILVGLLNFFFCHHTKFFLT